VEQLTPRELEVLQALADGLSDKEMSMSLHVCVGTVRNRLVSIFGKLGVDSRLQALVFALRHGAVRVGDGGGQAPAGSSRGTERLLAATHPTS